MFQTARFSFVFLIATGLFWLPANNRSVAAGIDGSNPAPELTAMTGMEPDRTDDVEDKESEASYENTHVQSHKFTPTHEGAAVDLSSFRVRDDGSIVACVSPRNKKADDHSDSLTMGYIQIWSPDLKLEAEYPLPFSPTAVDLDASGNMFVGGSGTVARLNRDGEIEISADSPNLAGVESEELKREILESMKEQQERMQKIYQAQIEKFEEQIAKIETVDKEERTDAQNRKLESIKANLDSYQQILDSQVAELDEADIKRRIKASGRITGLAVGGQDVFIATSARSGSGYEVYRVNREFEESKRVLRKLSGCCGQMDIHAAEGKIYVAENTKFRVGVYDRDGEEITGFGNRLRGDNQGFGSCCNPMNVLCCSNGDVLTAESSIGKIKRYNPDGELIAYVGRARIGGGCKHVAFGHDRQRDRYYVQFEDNHEICILEPAKSAANVDSRAAKMGQKLTGGKWRLQIAEGGPADDSFQGIGVELTTNDGGQIEVASVYEGSPAERRKIQPGDTILAVGEPGEKSESTKGLSAEEVLDRIRGASSGFIRLLVRPADNPDSKRRISMRRVRFERHGDQWQIAESSNEDMFSLESLTAIESLEFGADGSIKLEMENSEGPGLNQTGLRWVADRIEDDTLCIDLEAGDDMITYHLKIRIANDDQAEISIAYSGLGDAGEFRQYRRLPVDSR